MRSDPVLPFRVLRPDGDAIDVRDWFLRESGEAGVAPLNPAIGIEGWAYNIPIKVARKVILEPEKIRQLLEISGSDAEFEVLVIGKVGSLGQRSVLDRFTVTGTDRVSREIEIEIDSHGVCEHITLITCMTLKNDLTGYPEWAPSVAGSRLWSDEVRFPVEGTGGKFRIEDLKFSENHRIPSDIPWHLEWNPELAHYSFNSVVKLLVNSEQKEFVEKLISGDGLLTREVMGEIVCEICLHMIGRESFLSDHEPYPEGSLGEMTRYWLDTAFPGATLEQISQQNRRSPNLVASQLRALAGLI